MNSSKIGMSASLFGIVIFIAFFLSEIAGAILHRPFTGMVYGVLLLGVAGGLLLYRVQRNAVIFLLGYGAILSLSLTNALLRNIPSSYAFGELGYYLKPALFFLLGYYFIERKNYDRLMTMVFCLMMLSTVVFIVHPHTLVRLSSYKLTAKGYQVMAGFMTSFVPGKGIVLRNPGIVLGALEASFVSLYLTCYYLFYKRGILFGHILPSLLAMGSLFMLLTTITRSSLLGVCTAALIYGLVMARFRFKWLVIGMVITGAIISGIYFRPHIERYVASEGSASIHRNNLKGALQHLEMYTEGTGLGTAGWNQAPSPLSIYSEGSLFTSLIENGVQFFIFYGIIMLITLRNSKNFLFPVFAGYLVTATMIPIGMTTHFNLLFFSALGISAREYPSFYE